MDSRDHFTEFPTLKGEQGGHVLLSPAASRTCLCFVIAGLGTLLPLGSSTLLMLLAPRLWLVEHLSHPVCRTKNLQFGEEEKGKGNSISPLSTRLLFHNKAPLFLGLIQLCSQWIKNPKEMCKYISPSKTWMGF